MRYYEIIFMIHPDHSDRAKNIINNYITLIKNNKGKIHRLEDWGRKQLAYAINKLHKAHYVLMNIEVKPEIISKIETSFRFSDLIIRNIIIAIKNIVTTPSPMMKLNDEIKEKNENIKKTML
ncbi:30S ribosomal protein S6 [Buchnera aphidicola (Mindarus keteleerifoliae)]|uniref:30S ribosomal protein S6 n=1 Tax=Buchnera aphidicola TaxID=9 RepID=UPI0031B71C4A